MVLYAWNLKWKPLLTYELRQVYRLKACMCAIHRICGNSCRWAFRIFLKDWFDWNLLIWLWNLRTICRSNFVFTWIGFDKIEFVCCIWYYIIERLFKQIRPYEKVKENVMICLPKNIQDSAQTEKNILHRWLSGPINSSISQAFHSKWTVQNYWHT